MIAARLRPARCLRGSRCQRHTHHTGWLQQHRTTRVSGLRSDPCEPQDLLRSLRLTPSLLSISGFAVGDDSRRVPTPVAFSKAHKNLTTLHIAEWLTSDSRRLERALHLQAGLFQVEVALDAVHDLVSDATLVAHRDEPQALGPQQLDHEVLVGGRAFFDALRIALEAGGKAVAAVNVEAANALGRVLAHPVLVGKLVQALQGCLCDTDATVSLFLIPDAVVLEAEGPDQDRQGETLDHERREDHAKRQKDDEVAVGKEHP